MGQSNEPLTIYLQQSNDFNGDRPYNSPAGHQAEVLCAVKRRVISPRGGEGGCGAGREGDGRLTR